MKIPQLFIKAGNNRFIPVSNPIRGKAIYFWDDSIEQIVPADSRLQKEIIHGRHYLILKSSTSRSNSGGIKLISLDLRNDTE